MPEEIRTVTAVNNTKISMTADEFDAYFKAEHEKAQALLEKQEAAYKALTAIDAAMDKQAHGPLNEG